MSNRTISRAKRSASPVASEVDRASPPAPGGSREGPSPAKKPKKELRHSTYVTRYRADGGTVTREIPGDLVQSDEIDTISSGEDDGAKPLQKGDTPYRPSTGRRLVGTLDNPPPPRTRRTTRQQHEREAQASGDNDAVGWQTVKRSKKSNRASEASSDGSDIEFVGMNRGRNSGGSTSNRYELLRAVKDKGDKATNSERASTSKVKGQPSRHREVVRSPSAPRSKKGGKATKRSTSVSTTFTDHSDEDDEPLKEDVIDDEAEEDNDESDSGHGRDKRKVSLDEYDSQDSFINDGEVTEAESSSSEEEFTASRSTKRDRHRSRRHRRSRSPEYPATPSRNNRSSRSGRRSRRVVSSDEDRDEVRESTRWSLSPARSGRMRSNHTSLSRSSRRRRGREYNRHRGRRSQRSRSSSISSAITHIRGKAKDRSPSSSIVRGAKRARRKYSSSEESDQEAPRKRTKRGRGQCGTSSRHRIDESEDSDSQHEEDQPSARLDRDRSARSNRDGGKTTSSHGAKRSNAVAHEGGRRNSRNSKEQQQSVNRADYHVNEFPRTPRPHPSLGENPSPHVPLPRLEDFPTPTWPNLDFGFIDGLDPDVGPRHPEPEQRGSAKSLPALRSPILLTSDVRKKPSVATPNTSVPALPTPDPTPTATVNQEPQPGVTTAPPSTGGDPAATTEDHGAAVKREPDEEGSFAAAVASNPNLTVAEVANAGIRRLLTLPAVDGSAAPEDRDSLLLEDYKPGNLPNLGNGTFVPWTDEEGDGLMRFSEWGRRCPHLNFKLALRNIRFKRWGRNINPSRESPLTCYGREGRGGKVQLETDGAFAICHTAIMVTKSVLHPPPGHDFRTKYVSGIPHGQEWQRAMAFFADCLGHPAMRANYGRNIQSFVTMTDFRIENPKGEPSKKKRKNDTQAVWDNRFVLSNTADVPIYDLRHNAGFNFAEDFDSLHTLPRFEGEIPLGAFVNVAYTAGTYEDSLNNVHIGLNIQYALVLAVRKVKPRGRPYQSSESKAEGSGSGNNDNKTAGSGKAGGSEGEGSSTGNAAMEPTVSSG